MGFKFGDIVLNEWAGEKNPHRIGVVVYCNRIVKCTDTKGSFWEFDNGKNLRLTKLGEINLSSFQTIKEAQPEQGEK